MLFLRVYRNKLIEFSLQPYEVHPAIIFILQLGKLRYNLNNLLSVTLLVHEEVAFEPLPSPQAVPPPMEKHKFFFFLTLFCAVLLR